MKNQYHPLAESKNWILLLVAVGVICIAVTTTAVMVLPQAPPQETPTPMPTVSPTSTPTPTGVVWGPSPTPVPTLIKPIGTTTPTPEPTPTPTPEFRYCDETGCHDGMPPTPTPTPTPAPEPTPTPTPAPLWQTMGMSCEVPDYLLGEQWIKAYKYSCTCAIRAQYDLGLAFSPFEGCIAGGAWRSASCDCVDEICSHEQGLC